jgi:hypothetical protein
MASVATGVLECSRAPVRRAIYPWMADTDPLSFLLTPCLAHVTRFVCATPAAREEAVCAAMRQTFLERSDRGERPRSLRFGAQPGRRVRFELDCPLPRGLHRVVSRRYDVVLLGAKDPDASALALVRRGVTVVGLLADGFGDFEPRRRGLSALLEQPVSAPWIGQYLAVTPSGIVVEFDSWEGLRAGARAISKK